MFSLQQESKAVATSGEAKGHSYQKSSCEKRKPSSNLSEDQTPPKRQKEKRKSYKKGSKKDHDKEQDVSGTNKTEETEINFDKRENSNVKLKKDSMNEKAKYRDQCTAFISNLSLTVSERKIYFLSHCSSYVLPFCPCLSRFCSCYLELVSYLS